MRRGSSTATGDAANYREKAKEDFNGRCERCGDPLEWSEVEVHHVDRDRQNPNRDNLENARELVRRIERERELELLAPAPLNVVCFRYRAEGLDDAAQNELNQELLVRLQESGAAVPSQTVLAGRFALRVAITNHRTRSSDLERLVAEVLELGAALVSARSTPTPSRSRT